MARIKCAEDLFWPTLGHAVETIANLDAIPIEECGEEIVDLAIVCPGVAIEARAGGRLWARASVGERLNQAQNRLTELRPDVRLVILDAWRSPGRQTRMHYVARFIYRLRYPYLSSALIREAANKYVAAPDAVAPPPHSTGGAIDLRLRHVGSGSNLPMGSASRTDHEGVIGVARENRVLLCEVMNAAGFSNYEEEWWHWSYGDSGWALRSNQPQAIYGRTEPPRNTVKS